MPSLVSLELAGCARARRRLTHTDVLPRRAGHGAYDAFVHKFGRRHCTAEEYWGRQQVFQDSIDLIQRHNAGGASHK